ncbi:PD-(D/E)XK nuclease domain-containing protein [Angustibacter luteus]|uniref:Uncharacterized protein n=1 Tax=Angustibacter luteus TaxID=658456 RepID=A0ABW1JFE0_9ACTN
MTDLKEACRDLFAALDEGKRVICIHYSCENFHDVTDRPVAVSAIAVSELTDATGGRESTVFSIANSSANQDPVEREKEMFARFFEYARTRPDAFWVHWNMNNATYGFSALISRYRYLLGSEPNSPWQSNRLFDLDSLVGARYGDQFAKHPKLLSLCSLNGYFLSFFKAGRDEAKAFSDGDYGLCERSTAEKSHLLASILTDFRAGSLRTQNSVGSLHFASEPLDAVKVVLAIGDRFRYVERQLLRRHASRDTLKIQDEYDAQDLLRALLAVFFEDIRPEEVAPKLGGASSRIDFILPDYALALELKYARSSMTSASLGEELIVDRDRYQSRQEIQHLICLVFDHDGQLDNPRGLERDLSREASLESFAVTVRIYDR